MTTDNNDTETTLVDSPPRPEWPRTLGDENTLLRRYVRDERELLARIRIACRNGRPLPDDLRERIDLVMLEPSPPGPWDPR
jgi:hypothetical protein